MLRIEPTIQKTLAKNQTQNYKIFNILAKNRIGPKNFPSRELNTKLSKKFSITMLRIKHKDF